MIFIGDIVHSHTIQFDRPQTAIDFDIDPKKAVETRLKYFAEYAKNGQTVAAPHLPFPGDSGSTTFTISGNWACLF